MSNVYKVTEELICDEGGEHRAFGIQLQTEDGESIAYLPSLFFDRQRAECFTELCNRLALSPRHLSEIADDILAE